MAYNRGHISQHSFLPDPRQRKYMSILARLFLLLITCTAWAQEDELLEPEKAFAFTAVVSENGAIEAQWKIADGYYMYRDKFDFTIESEAVELDNVVYPKGKIKSDDLFGDVEVFTHVADIQVALKGQPGQAFKLIAKGQGCNEPIGVCYPPQSYEVNLTSALLDTLTQPAAAQLLLEKPKMSEANTELDSVEQLRNLLGSTMGGPEFLEVDDAFQLQLQAVDGANIKARFSVTDGYYLYREKIEFSGDSKARVASIGLPAGTIKDDEYFGKMEVYKHDFKAPLVIQRADNLTSTITINATYQGCAEEGICYAPVKKEFTLELPDLIADANAAQISMASSTIATNQQPADAPAHDNGAGSFWSLIVGSFIAGILLTFTPCVLPLIPILSSVIAGQGEKLTKMRGGSLAIVYVLGTAVAYAIIGWVAGATGEQLQAYFQNPWAIGILTGLFVLMALSMFGLFEIQMPSFIQSSMQEKTQGMSGTWPKVFVLGVVSALIVGACVSPILISFLGIAMQQGDPVLGAEIMFAMALGMGIPLIALGFGAGYLIPKAGMWMDTVKYVFGVMLIAVAIYLLGALPQVPVLLLWAALMIVVGVYLGATQTLPEGVSGWRVLFKGVGTLLLIWGILSLIGGFYGQRDPLKPLPQNLFSSTGSASSQGFQPDRHILTRVDNLDQLDQHLAQAQNQSKLVMLDYYADWCTDCIRMEESTLLDPQVQQILKQDFIALQVDVTDPNDDERAAIKKRYNVFGPPAVLFFDRDGHQVKDKNFYGYKSPADFLALISSL